MVMPLTLWLRRKPTRVVTRYHNRNLWFIEGTGWDFETEDQAVAACKQFGWKSDIRPLCCGRKR